MVAREFTILVSLAPGLPTVEEPGGCKAHKRRVNIAAATLCEFCSRIRHAVGVPDDDRFELTLFDEGAFDEYVALIRLADVPDKARIQLKLRAREPVASGEQPVVPVVRETGRPGNRSFRTPPQDLVPETPEPKAEPPVVKKESPLQVAASVDAEVYTAAGGGAAHDAIQTGTGSWNEDEKEAFVLGLQQFGKNWKMVATVIFAEGWTQCRFADCADARADWRVPPCAMVLASLCCRNRGAARAIAPSPPTLCH